MFATLGHLAPPPGGGGSGGGADSPMTAMMAALEHCAPPALRRESEGGGTTASTTVPEVSVRAPAAVGEGIEADEGGSGRDRPSGADGNNSSRRRMNLTASSLPLPATAGVVDFGRQNHAGEGEGEAAAAGMMVR